MINYRNVQTQFLHFSHETKEKMLFLLIDLCQCEYPLLAAIQNRQLALTYTLDFKKIPEEYIKEEEPLLLAIDIKNANHPGILKKICGINFMNNRLLAFNSRYPYGTLEVHLRRAMLVRWKRRKEYCDFICRICFIQ